MQKQFFGVFGDADEFERLRSPHEFDTIVGGDVATVGIRDPGLGHPGRSDTYSGPKGDCVVWGEAYAPGTHSNVAEWVLDRFDERGREAFSELNGSYLVFVEREGEAFVVTDPIRSWDCFYADTARGRVFSSDAAAVARTLSGHAVRRDALLEFLHLGVVLGEKSLLERMFRLPIDSVLTESAVHDLSRFVYEPKEFDYVQELADRLGRAVRRRARMPGRKGLLLSAGYDSRTVLSKMPEIEHCYTVGHPEGQETEGARTLATQYGAEHTAFRPTHRYLMADESKVRYSQGIKESLHIHHAGYTDEMEVDSMFHGLLCDTFLRGHFLAQDGVELFGKTVPFRRLDPNPNPVENLLSKLGYMPEASRAVAEQLVGLDADPATFVRDAVSREFEKAWDRADGVQNAIDLTGISNQPSTPFRTHLADNFFESFVIADAELLDWHLTTPPQYRNTATFIKALRRLDDDILRNPPPDRPYDTQIFNHVEGFLRRKLPLVEGFESPWPDRRDIYSEYELDEALFPDEPYVHDLPVRHKLRINDSFGWLELCTERSIRPKEVFAVDERVPDTGKRGV
ncbi:asparagine synthase-related protein [Haloprofundus halobius]|uniref:asparagine synthase-related protein n=1 Tax=Haloprofundus halobius TaxID=2876194 RepID=UPI001CCF40B3|nr:asparagine synthase-related protein [Haloprofundus halobius]